MTGCRWREPKWAWHPPHGTSAPSKCPPCNRAKRPFKPVRKTVTIIVPPCFWVIWWDATPAAVYTLECLGMGMPVELFAGAGLVSHIWVGTKIRQQPIEINNNNIFKKISPALPPSTRALMWSIRVAEIEGFQGSKTVTGWTARRWPVSQLPHPHTHPTTPPPTASQAGLSLGLSDLCHI